VVAQGNYQVLHAFTGGSDGGGLYAGVASDQAGSLYGVTSGGGAYGSGTAFKLSRSSGNHWIKTIIHSFCSLPRCDDGALPSTTPVLDSAGNVYGNSNIAIFQLTPGPALASEWSFQVIYNSGSDGLLLDKSGNLYGQWGPGKYKAGDVFELTPGSDGWTEKVLYNFCSRTNCNDGILPQYGLTWDAAGNLYGATTEGGVDKAGVAFELEHTSGGWKERVLHSFPASPSDGYPPSSGLTVDGSGNVYGATFQNGKGDGTIFKLSGQQDGRWKETILYDFHNPVQNGGAPVGGVAFDNKGNLYGTASAGGDLNCQCGVVFKMTPGSNGKWSYRVLYRFTGKDGNGPGATLIFDKNYKHLYGTTVAGGPGGYGVVYEITP
jgi:uncharacterized repeat protein (TIGR03803 family)